MNGQPDEEDRAAGRSFLGTYKAGQVHLDAPVDWPEGTRAEVTIASVRRPEAGSVVGPAIVAGFGLAGRWAVELFERYDIDYVVVERNAQTISRQRQLGRRAIQGDICDEQTLRLAGIEEAEILALTIPQEQAVLRATVLARKLNPSVYIIARTTYASAGLEASRLGASDVVKAEQAVAREFYEKLMRRLAELCEVVGTRNDGAV
jgi:CPA2 family monovalent cation:H+ antiporter-2